jgi:hypothetical protein
MAKNRKSLAKERRIEGQFIAIPFDVLYSEAYKRLSHPARSLLLELCLQYRGVNNGMLLASMRYLKKRGWNSADVITRAKRELLASGMIFETVKGRRPSIASWYALTWQTLDQNANYDVGVFKSFKRGLYRESDVFIAKVIPFGGVSIDDTKPRDGARLQGRVPASGAVLPENRHLLDP